MQIRSKAYLHFISLWRSLRHSISLHDGEASPALIYTVIVLTFLLAILEVDAHRATLESFDLLGNAYPISAVFMGP